MPQPPAKFTADEKARIIRSIRASERARPTLPALTDLAQDYKDSVPAYNNSDLDIPQYAALQIDGTHTDEVSAIVSRPTRPSFGPLAIAATAIPTGATGRVWIGGVHPVMFYNPTAFNPVAVGDALISWFADFRVRPFGAGPMSAADDTTQLVGHPDSQYAVLLADLHGHTPAGINVVSYTPNIRGIYDNYPCHTLILSGRMRATAAFTRGRILDVEAVSR